MESKILVMNMKMYMDIDDIREYMKQIDNVPDNVILCPESIYIPYFLKKYKNIAIQSIYPVDSGAYTGCVSASQVKKMGVNYAIVGHSECRKYFNVTDNEANLKVKSALANKLKVILCIGDSKEEKDNGKTFSSLKRQLDIALNDIKSDDIIVAYEPIYSIGTGLIPSMDEISKTVKFIKNELKNKNMNLKVIYGGSVNSKNISDLVRIDCVDGFMVGKSSSIVDEVKRMIEVVSC